MVTSWQKDSLSQRAAVELQGCRFNSCWQACNCIKTVCTSTSVGSTNVKLLCWVVILLPEKTNKQKLNVLSKDPSLEMLSFCLFFFSGSNITTQHSNCNCIPLQLLSHSSKEPVALVYLIVLLYCIDIFFIHSMYTCSVM
jgi:hypothetical protein